MQVKELAICAGLLIYGFWLEVVAADQTGFVSLDCGGATSGTYTSVEGLTWTPDTMVAGGFGLGNVSRTVAVNSPNVSPPVRYTRIRYFEGAQSKYCYVFDERSHGIQQDKAYLVRASFWLGSGELPFSTSPNSIDPDTIRFQLLLNADVWDNISMVVPQTVAVVKEAMVIAQLPSLSVCLAGRSVGLDTAFISSLEIRPLAEELDAVLRMRNAEVTSYALFLQSRLNFGSVSQADVRYPDDIYDRIWMANTTEPRLNASEKYNSSAYANKVYYNNPPDKVLQTALESSTNNTPLVIALDGFTGNHAYFYMLFFYELSEKVIEQGQRSLSVTTLTGGRTLESLLDPTTLNFTFNILHETYNADAQVRVGDGGQLGFQIEKLSTATYGPFINGLEVYLISDLEMSLGAHAADVAAIDTIKSEIEGLDGWSGDPCLPYAFEWLSCSQETRPRVVSLVLSNKRMVGEIPSNISILTSLVELDLRDNKLTGSIPDFLAELPNLRILNLQNNNLSGAIPKALLSKVKSSYLNLSIADNPFLCGDLTHQSSCNIIGAIGVVEEPNKESNASKLMGWLIGSIGAIIVLIIFGLCAYFYLKRRSHVEKPDAINNGQEILSHRRVVECSNQVREFTYKEIQAISNMFSTKIGQGGFGSVYHGTLDDGVNVALKVSQQGSTQGPQEFLNEVTLLSRIHHRNLIEHIGYCIQEKLVLVYEYMSNGSLHYFLFGKSNKRLLSWIQRLNILVGSAEGLEYLHKGCNPAIIHRDVKSSNILLNDQMVAKISDFGISRASLYKFEEGSHLEMVTQVQGSYGYLDPEHFQTSQINEKTDVYAFGIVMLEVVSGKPPIIQGKHPLTEWVRSFVDQGDISKIVDPSIANDKYNLSSMWKVVEIALRCVEHKGHMRPDMSEVCSELKLALSMELENQDSTCGYSQNFSSIVRAR